MKRIKYKAVIVPSSRCLAGALVGTIITPTEGSIRSAAERLVNIETLASVGHLGPLPPTRGVVDGNLDVVPPVGLEVLVISQPSLDLPAENVPDGLSRLDVDQVLLTGIQRDSLQLSQLNRDQLVYLIDQHHHHYNRVASGIGSLDVAVVIVKALWTDGLTKDLFILGRSDPLQGIWESSYPSDGMVSSESFKEHSTLVLISTNHLLELVN